MNMRKSIKTYNKKKTEREREKKHVNLSQYFCFSLILGYRLFNFLKNAQKQMVQFFWLIRRNTDGYLATDKVHK